MTTPTKPGWSAPRRVWVAYLQAWGAWLPRYRRLTRDQIAGEFYDRKPPSMEGHQ